MMWPNCGQAGRGGGGEGRRDAVVSWVRQWGGLGQLPLPCYHPWLSAIPQQEPPDAAPCCEGRKQRLLLPALCCAPGGRAAGGRPRPQCPWRRCRSGGRWRRTCSACEEAAGRREGGAAQGGPATLRRGCVKHAAGTIYSAGAGSTAVSCRVTQLQVHSTQCRAAVQGSSAAPRLHRPIHAGAPTGR